MPNPSILVVAALLLASRAPQAPAPPSASPTPTPGAYHAVFLELGPAWDRTKGVREQRGLEEHGRYMTSLSEKGTIVVGGPFLAGTSGPLATGAMVVIATADPEDARRVMEADPGVKAGLFTLGDVRRFYIGTGSWRPWAAAATTTTR
jgi:uncharacterized protein YciI